MGKSLVSCFFETQCTFDLSLISKHISDWRQFSDVHISQSSVATCLWRGGIFKHVFVVNLLPSPAMKKV